MDFTETHHALLFGWIAKAVIEQIGEARGEAALRKAVQQYGNERGHRMALRASANREPLTMANYLAYGEWRSTPGNAHDVQVIEKKPDARVQMRKCPWYGAWKENGLVPYGRLYCLEIDKALVQGFNPGLRLDVNATQPDGADCCEFVYHGATFSLPSYLLLAYKKAIYPGKSAVMPWEYHLGHLFATLEKVLLAELSEPGNKAVQAGLAEFTRWFGEPAAQAILTYRSIDFNRLPAGS